MNSNAQDRYCSQTDADIWDRPYAYMPAWQQRYVQILWTAIAVNLVTIPLSIGLFLLGHSAVLFFGPFGTSLVLTAIGLQLIFRRLRSTGAR